MKKFTTLILILLAGCSVETPIDAPASAKEQESVRLSIAIPAAGERRDTRALTEAGESLVAEVDMLQFDPATGKFAFHSQGEGITGAGNTRNFDARMLTGTWDVVFLVNSRSLLNSAMSGFDTDTELQDLLDMLTVTTAAQDKLTSNVLPRLPMSGFLNNVDVAKGAALPTVTMVRSVAKIDVELSAAAANRLVLADVRLYNQPLKGWFAPEFEGWPADNKAVTPWFGGAATVPMADYPTDQPVVYNATSGDNVSAAGVVTSIYTWEAPAGSASTPETNVCIVVGGYLDNSPTMSYYRVDIRRESDDYYYPILRGNVYNVNVESVSGAGYGTPEDAFKGTPRLKAEVTAYNNMGLDVIVDGEYTLAVDRDRIEMYENGAAASGLSAVTNYNISNRGYPRGLRVVVDASWLTITGGSEGDLSRTLVFTGTANNTGSVRSANVVIYAGNMRKTITVTQEPFIPGVKAVYGVIGTIWNPGGANHLTPTIEGDRDYFGGDPAAGEFYSTQDQYRVYAAYFMYGSLVGATSRWMPKVRFTPSQVVMFPSEWAADRDEMLAKFAGRADGVDAWKAVPVFHEAYTSASTLSPQNDPANAFGDPCQYFDARYFGGQGWKTPSEADLKALLGYSTSSYVQAVGDGTIYDYVAGGSPNDSTGVTDPGRAILRAWTQGTIALPAAGSVDMRVGTDQYNPDGAGYAQTVGERGVYMTTIRTMGVNGGSWPLLCYPTAVNIINGTYYGKAAMMPVRCVIP